MCVISLESWEFYAISQNDGEEGNWGHINTFVDGNIWQQYIEADHEQQIHISEIVNEDGSRLLLTHIRMWNIFCACTMQRIENQLNMENI